jgi:hypothetical protein
MYHRKGVAGEMLWRCIKTKGIGAMKRDDMRLRGVERDYHNLYYHDRVHQSIIIIS